MEMEGLNYACPMSACRVGSHRRRRKRRRRM
jgi:hypothetical protein